VLALVLLRSREVRHVLVGQAGDDHAADAGPGDRRLDRVLDPHAGLLGRLAGHGHDHPVPDPHCHERDGDWDAPRDAVHADLVPLWLVGDDRAAPPLEVLVRHVEERAALLL
jgi:hypothetical protein